MSKVPRVLRILSMRCDESVELLSQSADERLPLVDRLALASHLLLCKPCRRFGRQLAFVRTAIQRLVVRVEDSSEALSGEARNRIERLLRSEAAE